MPDPATTPRPPAPSTDNRTPGPTGPELVVVVPEAIALQRTETLLRLVRWLGAERERPPTVVCWQSGPLVAAFAEAVPVIDAGAVNRHLGARALAAARVTPAARALKSLQLRRALAPLAGCERFLLGGPDTIPLLEWLPSADNRRVAVWLDDGDTRRVDEVASVATSFLVGGDRVGAALRERGIAAERLHRVAEPLVAAAPDAGRHGLAERLVAVVDTGPSAIEALPVLLAAISGAGARPQPAVAWVHEDLRRSWARWTDPRFAGLEGQLVDWSLDECEERSDDIAALVLLGSTAAPLAAVATSRGVPVLTVGAGDDSVGIDHDDLAALADRLRALLRDPTVWAEASAQTLLRNAPHRVDHVGRSVLAALDLALP